MSRCVSEEQEFCAPSRGLPPLLCEALCRRGNYRFYMLLSVCLCVCLSLCVHAYVCVCVRACVCACVCSLSTVQFSLLCLHHSSSLTTVGPLTCISLCTLQVEYEADGFLEKNNDSLPLAVVSLFQTSSNQLVRMCFM